MDKSDKRKVYHPPNARRRYFTNWNIKNKRFKNYLDIGMKGFLCTCNCREKDCIKEAYNILNEYADNLFGHDNVNVQPNIKKVEGEVSGDSEVEGDIEDELKKEVSSLKSDKIRDYEKFNTVDTGIKAKIFIKTTIEDPLKLGYTIVSDIAATKAQKSRFLLRIVPVELTCKANLEDIKTAADTQLFDKHFKCDPTTFAVAVSVTYNNSVVKDEVIHSLAVLVTDRNRDHKANLKDAKKTVFVDIMKGICCMSVLEDYKKLKHYNIAELSKTEEGEKEVSKGAEEKKQEDNNQNDEIEDVAEINEGGQNAETSM